MLLVQHDAQLWNDLLDRSGGALEASKYAFNTAEYGFTPTGKPFYKHFQQNHASIQIYKPLTPRQEKKNSILKLPTKE
jgi:hypothetical protein